MITPADGLAFFISAIIEILSWVILFWIFFYYWINGLYLRKNIKKFRTSIKSKIPKNTVEVKIVKYLSTFAYVFLESFSFAWLKKKGSAAYWKAWINNVIKILSL